MNVVRIVSLGACAVVLAACASGSDTNEATDTTTTAPPPPTTAVAQTPSTTLAATTTTTTPAPTTTTTTAPVPCDPVPLEEGLGERTGNGHAIAPGCYRVDQLSRSFVFELDEPGVSYLETDHAVVFGEDGTVWEQPNLMVLVEFIGVIPPADAGEHPSHDVPMESLMDPVPADLAEWFEATPQTVVVDSGTTKVAGSEATWWDVDIDPATDTFSCGFGWCIGALIPPPPDGRGTNYVMASHWRHRIIQVDGDGEGLFVWIQAFPGSFADTIAMAEAVLERMRFVD